LIETKMEKRWINRRINLKTLTDYIGNFFKKWDFEAIKGKTATGYQIFAGNSPYFPIEGYVSITIEGKPDDFIVKFEFCRDKKKRFFMPAMFSTLLLGGYFLSKKLEKRENMIKLEKEFWRHVENAVLSLGNSAYPKS